MVQLFFGEELTPKVILWVHKLVAGVAGIVEIQIVLRSVPRLVGIKKVYVEEEFLLVLITL